MMAKKYAVLRLRTQKPEGGFWEAFRLGLVEFGSTGDEYFDESGYPFPDEVHAFVQDWINLSGDFQRATRKLDEMRLEHNSGMAGVGNGQGKEGQFDATERAGK